MAKQAAHATSFERERAELGRLEQKLIKQLKRAGFKDPLSTALRRARDTEQADARAAEQYAAEQAEMDLRMGLVDRTLGVQHAGTRWEFGVIQAQSAQSASAPDARRIVPSSRHALQVNPTRGADDAAAAGDARLGLGTPTDPGVRRVGNALVFGYGADRGDA